jgi:hypothetical protein
MSSQSDAHDSDKLFNQELDTLGVDLSQQVTLQGEIPVQERLPQSTTTSVAASNVSTNDHHVPDENFGESSGNLSRNDNAHLLRDLQSGPPLPSFLGDGQIREAMRRANTLHQQRHGFPAVPPTQLDNLGWGGSGNDRTVRNPVPDFSPPFIPRQQAPLGVVPQKFEPGHESSSVMQLTKRPRMRSKDIAHRKSLISSDFPRQVFSPEVSPANPFACINGSPSGVTPTRYVNPPMSVNIPDTFLINLKFGARLVGVPVTFNLSVRDVTITAVRIAGVDPSVIKLRFGDIELHPDGLLRNYLSHQNIMGAVLTVVPAAALTTPGIVPIFPREIVAYPDAGQPMQPASFSGPPPSPGVPNFVFQPYQINLAYENGRIERQTVWDAMLVSELRGVVAATSQVHPNTVFLVFDVLLVDDRRLLDPPPILAEDYVHVFFSMTSASWFMTTTSFPPSSQPGRRDAANGLFASPSAERLVQPLSGSAQPTFSHLPSSPSNDKLRASFKCPKFLGESRHWKAWNKGFVRFLAIQMLDHVISEFFMQTSLTPKHQEDNKLVYYILEDAVSGSPLAAKYVRKAAEWNGHEAYNFLYDGFAFSGPATATLLLSALNNFRFLVDETSSELCLRLQELFEDLAAVPGASAIEFSDTQKINYLLSAIRHERSLSSVYTQIQTDQIRGRITFEQACDDLRYRCECIRADELLDSSARPAKVRGFLTNVTTDDVTPDSTLTALLTSAAKRQNGEALRPSRRPPKEQVQCLAKGCSTLTPPHLRLCRIHYHECIAGKNPSMALKTGDNAHYDASTNKVVFPHLQEKSAPGGKPGSPSSQNFSTNKKGSIRTLAAEISSKTTNQGSPKVAGN